MLYYAERRNDKPSGKGGMMRIVPILLIMGVAVGMAQTQRIVVAEEFTRVQE